MATNAATPRMMEAANSNNCPRLDLLSRQAIFQGQEVRMDLMVGRLRPAQIRFRLNAPEHGTKSAPGSGPVYGGSLNPDRR